MYTLLRSLALRILKAPTQPPEAPAGSHDSVRVFRASRNFLRYRLLGFGIIVALVWLGLIILPVAAWTLDEPGLLALAVIAALPTLIFQLVIYFLIRIDYDMRYYVVTDRSLRVRHGAWTVREMTITYANVQNLKVVQGPLERLFGIWNLQVQTAGGGSAQPGEATQAAHLVNMAGISNAHEVRTLILGHLRARSAGAGLGDLDDNDGSRPARGDELLGELRRLQEAAAGLRRAAEGARVSKA